MKVFLSWSGSTSKAVAEALRDWLPNVIQDIEPWMSERDIDAGTRWSIEVGRQLEATGVGILCLTPDNLEAAWLIFEAGALSKTLDSSRVIPYLFNVEPANLKGPLAQFQGTRANKVDTKKMVQTINRALSAKEKPLSENQLDKVFEKWWFDLEQTLLKVPSNETKNLPHRSDRELLEEILELVRTENRSASVSRQMSIVEEAEWLLALKLAFGLSDDELNEARRIKQYVINQVVERAAKEYAAKQVAYYSKPSRPTSAK